MPARRLCFLPLLLFAMLGCDRQAAEPPHADGAGVETADAKPPAARAEEPFLDLDTWADYIAPNVIPNFERETGIKVRVSTFDSDQILETKLLIGHTGYDVVMPTGPYFRRMLNAGVFQKLDKAALTNYGNLDPAILKRLAEYDPGNLHAVPYLHTTVGIAYNVDKLQARLGVPVPDSWALMFDPAIATKLRDCGITYADSPIQVFSAAIQYLGKDPQLLQEDNVVAAAQVLRQVRPYLRYIDSAMHVNDLANGDVCISLTWAGDAVLARERARDAHNGVRIAYIIPKEGGQMTIDAVGIPSDAPHPRNALRWLNYLMRADVMADITNFVKYPNGNLAATPLIDDALRHDNGIYPDADTQRRLINAISPSPEYSLIVNREWTHFRSGT